MTVRPKVEIRSYENRPGEWCAEAEVDGRVLTAKLASTEAAAFQALGEALWRGQRAHAAALQAWHGEVLRRDPWREWRALGRRLARIFWRRS